MEITAQPALELGEGVRAGMSRVFVEGYWGLLRMFSPDPEKLAAALEHIFLPEYFTVGLVDGEVASIAALTDGKAPCLVADRALLRRHLGLVKGNLAGSVLKKQFSTKPYPFPLEEGTGSLEYVTAAERFRSKGVAGTVVRRIFKDTVCKNYVLEVADTNTPAVHLFRRVGFSEFRREEARKWEVGVNHLLYMKRPGAGRRVK